jgi:hypothetical protein
VCLRQDSGAVGSVLRPVIVAVLILVGIRRCNLFGSQEIIGGLGLSSRLIVSFQT